MQTGVAGKGAYIGAGAGLVLFAIFGLLPGSLLGGIVGINVAAWLSGLSMESSLLQRVFALIGMLIGVVITGVAVVTAAATVGWLAGRLIVVASHRVKAGDDGSTAILERRSQ